MYVKLLATYSLNSARNQNIIIIVQNYSIVLDFQNNVRLILNSIQSYFYNK